MIRSFRADLHVHTLLSPCAAVEMTPRNIIRHAVEAGIDIVAITDHNAGDNVEAAFRAAVGTGVTVLPGMEVETSEEAHILTLFDKMSSFAKWREFVEAHRTDLLNNENRLGAQFIVDEEDNLIRSETVMLLAALKADVAIITAVVRELGGICVASHVDRPAYSLIGQLGFIPADVHLAAVEVSRVTPLEKARLLMPAIRGYPIIVSSDGHTVDDFLSGPKTIFFMEAPTIVEIRQALSGENGRRFSVEYPKEIR